ncbi:hypothetical protein BT69DRAFT_789660 [Atractiella rhizophila]|nr:hypothetical protein BT69DRAFT_789660 [Atractiella rhizophila]
MECSLSAEIRAIGGTAFVRKSTEMIYKGLNATTQQEAATFFEEALKLLYWRKRWVQDHRTPSQVNGPKRAERIGTYLYGELTEFPALVFSSYNYLEEYLQKLDGPLDLEMKTVLDAYESEVAKQPELTSAWLKSSLLSNVLTAESEDAKRHRLVCHTLRYLIGRGKFLHRYLNTPNLSPNTDRRDVVFWIAEAFKPAAYWMSSFSIRSMELMSYLQEMDNHILSIEFSSLTDATVDASILERGMSSANRSLNEKPWEATARELLTGIAEN